MTTLQPTRFAAKYRDNLYLLDTGVVFTCSEYNGTVQSPYSATIILASERSPIEVCVEGQIYRGVSLAIRPGVKHVVSAASGEYVGVRLVPTHPHFAAFCTIPAPGAVQLNRATIAPFDSILAAAYRGRLVRSQGEKILREIPLAAVENLPFARPVDARVDRVKKILRLNPKCTVAELSVIFGVSPGRISHFFSASLGLPIKSYLRWQRMHLATSQLAAGRPLTEIAYNAGYTDLSHFGREFREIAGVAPSSLFQSDHVNVFHWRENRMLGADRASNTVTATIARCSSTSNESAQTR